MHLPTLAALFLLSSPGMLKALVRYGKLGPDRVLHPKDPLETFLQEQLELEMKQGVGDVPLAQLRAAADSLKSVVPGGCSLLEGALLQLCGRFLCWGRDALRFKADHLLEVQEALERILPDQLMAVALRVYCLEADPPTGELRDLDAATLEDWLVGPLLPAADFPMLHLLEERGVPEMHRHHSLSALPILRWSELMRRPEHALQLMAKEGVGWVDKPRVEGLTNGELTDLLYRALIIRQNLLPRNVASTPQPNTEDEQTLRTQLASLTQPRTLLEWLPPPPRADGSLLDDVLRTNGVPRAYATARAGEHAQSAERNFLASLAYALVSQGRADRVMRASIHAYLLIQNLWTRAFVQPRHSEKGLERFVKDYVRDTRHKNLNASGNEELLAQAWVTGKVSHLELRVAPGGEQAKVNALLKAAEARRASSSLLNDVLFQDTAPRDLRSPEDDAPLPAIGLIVHFLKRKDKGDEGLPSDALFRGDRVRSVGERRTVMRQALTLAQSMSDPACAHALVGLDVASMETDLPTEVFAPAFRHLRRPYRREEPLDRLLFPNAHPRSPLGVTCHAGEEFFHLLTGMRAIDETVLFLEFQAGDRLGHGLALGLTPAGWASRLGESLRMKRGDVLDDLVWLYGRLVAMGEDGRFCRALEAKVAGLSSQVYGPGKEWRARHCTLVPAMPSMELLSRAWQFRGEDPLVELPPSVKASPALFGLVEDDLFLEDLLAKTWIRGGKARRKQARDTLGEDAEQLWWSYLTDPSERKQRDELIEVALVPGWFDAISRVQDTMLAEYAALGLVIEANPTSNLCIGPLDDLTQHPIFRWSGPDKGVGQSISVVVGTDDPAIFGTELIHEYAFLGAAALKRGFSLDSTIRWLERLRETGLKTTFIRPQQRAKRRTIPLGQRQA